MQFNNIMEWAKKHIILAIIIVVLAAGCAFFAVEYFLQVQVTQKAEREVSQLRNNARVINFLNLFITKVLKTDKEISFEDRLRLENAIRDINDPNILAKWEEFTGGTNESEIQAGVKNLLEALIKKIS